MAITCLIMSTFKTKLIQSRRSGPQSVRVKFQEWTGQLERVKFSLFVFLTIVLTALRVTTSDYPFGIFKHF
jgi:hypothetical protein